MSKCSAPCWTTHPVVLSNGTFLGTSIAALWPSANIMRPPGCISAQVSSSVIEYNSVREEVKLTTTYKTSLLSFGCYDQMMMMLWGLQVRSGEVRWGQVSPFNHVPSCVLRSHIVTIQFKSNGKRNSENSQPWKSDLRRNLIWIRFFSSVWTQPK